MLCSNPDHHGCRFSTPVADFHHGGTEGTEKHGEIPTLWVNVILKGIQTPKGWHYYRKNGFAQFHTITEVDFHHGGTENKEKHGGITILWVYVILKGIQTPKGWHYYRKMVCPIPQVQNPINQLVCSIPQVRNPINQLVCPIPQVRNAIKQLVCPIPQVRNPINQLVCPIPQVQIAINHKVCPSLQVQIAIN